MKCGLARKLFGAYWDDETTQAEREWLESHFVSCAKCRKEYEDFSRSLEWVGSLPRVDAAPELVDRVLGRARRSVSASDRMPVASIPWVPATAALALLLLAAALLTPWLPQIRGSRPADPLVAVRAPAEPVRVAPVGGGPAAGVADRGLSAAASDSLFDHSEDVEFILDPVTLRRGRAAVTRLPSGVQAEQAVISF